MVKKRKKVGFYGGCNFTSTSPSLAELAPDTPMLNLTVPFVDALKLQAAMAECIRELNLYNRATVEGKARSLNVAIHLTTGRITINEVTRPGAKRNRAQKTSRPS